MEHPCLLPLHVGDRYRLRGLNITPSDDAVNFLLDHGAPVACSASVGSMDLAKALQEQSVEVDVDSLIQGIKDTLSGGKARMSEEQVVAALQGLQTDHRMVQASLTRTALAEKNKR